MRLDSKIALITGSDQGIGQAIAIRLAEEGGHIAINFRSNRAGAEETRNRIENLGRRATVIQADVSKIPETRRLLEEAVRQLGAVDILVNNAGIEKNADFVNVTEEDYRSVIDTNMTGPFF